MEELLSQHRKEQRDLQSQITQKKKSASKKTRKGVNEECERLERGLRTKQAAEIAALGDQDATIQTSRPNSTPEQEALADGSDLLASIVPSATDDAAGKLQNVTLGGDQQHGSSIQQPQEQRKPNRQKARLARRAAEQDAASAQAAEEAANMPDLKTQERDKMLLEAKKRGLAEKEVAANGHCLYLAFADQMQQHKLSLDPALDLSKIRAADLAKWRETSDFKKVRMAAAEYIAANPIDFEPFLEEPLEQYLHKLRDTGEWGGQLELTALSKLYNVNINILQATGRLEKIESSDNNPSAHEIWLAYYRHGFGLGEHYNSLRKASAND